METDNSQNQSLNSQTKLDYSQMCELNCQSIKFRFRENRY